MDKEKIERLIKELEDPHSPFTSHWNFAVCENCAVGVAGSLGLFETPDRLRDAVTGEPHSTRLQRALGIEHREVFDMLFGFATPTLAQFQPRWRRLVSPAHVALALRKYLATGVASSPYNFIQD